MDAWGPGVVEIVEAIRANESSTIPDAADILSRDNLGKAARLDMSDLDEGRSEQQDVWWMPGCMGSDAFPFDGWG